MLSNGSATALDVTDDGNMIPTRIEDWIGLPVREEDRSIGVVKGRLRVPSVIVLARYDRIPMHRPRLSSRTIRERDGGKCQYTGRKLSPHEGTIDHVVPRSKGGGTTWENCVLSAREVNHRKADRTPDEAGLRLLKHPRAPKAVPVTMMLGNPFRIKDWEPFLLNSPGAA